MSAVFAPEADARGDPPELAVASEDYSVPPAAPHHTPDTLHVLTSGMPPLLLYPGLPCPAMPGTKSLFLP